MNKRTYINYLIRRRVMILAAAMVTISFWSCGDNVEPAFYIDVQREFNIPVGLNTIETHIFELRNVPMFLENGLAANGMTRDDISSIGPGDAVILSSFGNVDWSFVSWVEVYAISRLNPDLRERIFYIDSPDFNNRNQVTLFNTFSDMKEILNSDNIDLEVRIRINSFVPTSVSARIDFNYAVFNEI